MGKRAVSVKKLYPYLSAGLLILFMVGLFEPLNAETNTVGGANGASAHVDFVIQIPEVLTLAIVTPQDAGASLPPDPEGTHRPAAPQDRAKIAVSAAGTFSPGGVMALTATGGDPLSVGHGPPAIHAAINWTASRTQWTAGGPQDPSYFSAGRHTSPHAFSFRKSHRFQPGGTREPLFYIISAP